MKIYHAPNTRSVRIVWLFEELGLPYDLEKHKLGDPAMRLALPPSPAAPSADGPTTGR